MIGLELPPQNWPLATWWMVGSAGVFLVGLICGLLLQLVLARRDYFQVEQGLGTHGDAGSNASSSVARRWRHVLQYFTFRRALSTELGSFFFYVMVFGLITHLVFWIYVASWLTR